MNLNLLIGNTNYSGAFRVMLENFDDPIAGGFLNLEQLEDLETMITDMILTIQNHRKKHGVFKSNNRFEKSELSFQELMNCLMGK